jgi:hypothetical protein
MKDIWFAGLALIFAAACVDNTSHAASRIRKFTACIGDSGCRAWRPDYTFDPFVAAPHPGDDMAAAQSVCKRNMMSYVAVTRPVPATPGGCCGYIRLLITCAYPKAGRAM